VCRRDSQEAMHTKLARTRGWVDPHRPSSQVSLIPLYLVLAGEQFWFQCRLCAHVAPRFLDVEAFIGTSAHSEPDYAPSSSGALHSVERREWHDLETPICGQGRLCPIRWHSCAQARRVISWKSFLCNIFFENKGLAQRIWQWDEVRKCASACDRSPEFSP